MRRKLNYTEGLYFLAFVEDKAKRIDFARNVSENFLELFNAFMEDNVLTENEYQKLGMFLESIKHKIPAEIYEQFRQKVKTGDIITFDITKRRLDVNVTQKELAARLKKVKHPSPRYLSGVMGKYARHVSSASEGAVTT